LGALFQPSYGHLFTDYTAGHPYHFRAHLYSSLNQYDVSYTNDCTSKARGKQMKNQERKSVVYLTAVMVFGLILITGCAAIQIWPDYQRTAENKMFVIQDKIGDGLKSGALSLDQSQNFLTKLKKIRADYAALKDRSVYRDEWDSLIDRIDALGEEVDMALVRTTRIQEPVIGDRIVALQRRIDDGSISKRLSLTEERDFQFRLDTIRRDYMRMTESGRYATYEEEADISRRLDSLESDLNRTTRIEEPSNADRAISRGSAVSPEYALAPVDYSQYGRPPIPVKILLLIPAEFERFEHVGNYEAGSIRYHLGREAELEMRDAFGIEFAKVDVRQVRSETRAREMLFSNDPENALVRAYDFVAIPKFLRADSLERKEKYEFEIDLQVEFIANNDSSITLKGHGAYVIGNYAQTTPEKGATLTLQYAISAILDGIEKSRNFFVR
jgi:hypothetical protein